MDSIIDKFAENTAPVWCSNCSVGCNFVHICVSFKQSMLNLEWLSSSHLTQTFNVRPQESLTSHSAS